MGSISVYQLLLLRMGATGGQSYVWVLGLKIESKHQIRISRLW